MGLREHPQGTAGSMAVIQGMCIAAGRGVKGVYGGGDTLEFVSEYGVDKYIPEPAFKSMGGGAMLEAAAAEKIESMPGLMNLVKK